MNFLRTGLRALKRKIKWRVTDKNVGQIQKESSLYQNVIARYAKGVKKSQTWNFDDFRGNVLQFVDSCRTGSAVEYRFSCGSGESSLYTATYALMIRDLLLGQGGALSSAEKDEFISYFDSLQDPGTGYFIDKKLEDGEYINPDNREWWGYGHILLQVIICYSILGARPEHKFVFLEPFYEEEYLYKYLNGRNWKERIAFTGNELMNIGVALQYSRDFLGDARAGMALSKMQEWLSRAIDSQTGLWGDLSGVDQGARSQSVQGAYHIWPLFFYDRMDVPFADAAIDTLLHTQNYLGGYGCNPLQSTGCEDMDTIEPLYRFSRIAPHRKAEIDRSLRFALPWLLANQNDDGGFVFSPGSALHYGHNSLHSSADESNLFATWWRILSLAYLTDGLGIPNGFHLPECPGMAFPPR